jgi:CheY-like chemotaxis protein
MESTPPIRRRVLVADDNVYLTRTLRLVLEMWGFDATIVHDGSAALAAVRDIGPTAALVDIRLPKLDGLCVAREIRATCSAKGPLLIAMTGSNEDRDRSASLAAGFHHHLVKPIDPNLLRTLLEGL